MYTTLPQFAIPPTRLLCVAAVYFIQMGRVQIGNVDFSVVFAVKRALSYFGEFAMFTAQRRSASARALQVARRDPPAPILFWVVLPNEAIIPVRRRSLL